MARTLSLCLNRLKAVIMLSVLFPVPPFMLQNDMVFKLGLLHAFKQCDKITLPAWALFNYHEN